MFFSWLADIGAVPVLFVATRQNRTTRLMLLLLVAENLFLFWLLRFHSADYLVLD
jgi:hypothetical protein